MGQFEETEETFSFSWVYPLDIFFVGSFDFCVNEFL